MKKRVFLSLPMHGKTDEEILKTIDLMKNRTKIIYPKDELVFVDNFILTQEEAYECASSKCSRLAFLSKALFKMSNCDIVVILNSEDVDNGKHPGVLVEDMCAKYYGIPVYYIYLDD